MNKNIFFIFLNFYSLLVFSSYSTPTLLLPIVSADKSVSSMMLALIFSAFPIGAFPASIAIGKLMRFYKKDKLLLIFNTISSLSRLSIGLLYYVDDPTTFVIIGFIARMATGIAEGSLIPITYSFIPELFPDEMMVKYGILEIWGSVGIIIGSPLSSILYESFGYFAVFCIMASINLFVGMFIIIYFLRSDEIVRFKDSSKNSLPMKQALFSNSAVILNFLYLFFFFFPNFMIQTGFETYFETLTSNLYISAFVYSLILVGMVLGVYAIKYFYKKEYEKRMLFIFGLTVIFALTFYGPDPSFGITDSTTKIILIGIAFLIAGIAIEVIFLIITKALINDLLQVFPGEKELCADFANGLFTASFTLDQFLAPLVGDVLNETVGYDRTGFCYSTACLMFFIVYWAVMRKAKNNYDNMVEEVEEPEKNRKKSIEI